MARLVRTLRVRRGASLPGDAWKSLWSVGRHVAPGPYAPRAARRATSAILNVSRNRGRNGNTRRGVGRGHA